MMFSRRGFLKLSLAAGVATFSGGALSSGLVYSTEEGLDGPLPHIPFGGFIRPPGAVPEKDFRARCIGCGVCQNVCHTQRYDAITLIGFPHWTDIGTPHIKDRRDFPCALCMECPPKCPTGALQTIEKEKVRMGMALIDFSLCFGWNGDVCLSCSKACPLGAQIFEFNNGEWGNQPYINSQCVGCGLCVKYCPLGGSAIKVITQEQYRLARSPYQARYQSLLSMNSEQRYAVVYNENLPKIMNRGRLQEREYR